MEKVYQYFWHTRISRGKPLALADGRCLEVIDSGVPNHDAGPDFSNAKLKIAGTLWAGNVEIHVKASDWMRHGHHTDPAYNNIVLHVVGVNDAVIKRADGSLIPTYIMQIPPAAFAEFANLTEGLTDVRCARRLTEIPHLVKSNWMESLGMERMQRKAEAVHDIYTALNSDWEQTLFVLLARGLGFGLNAEPMELMARSLPLKVLHHHSDSMLQLQALLFGQAGMLDMSQRIFDEYYQQMCREYYFLARKYGLKPLRPVIWKYARTRPQNFPHRRIAFLAKACEGGFSLMRRLLDHAGEAPKDLRAIFDWELEPYWQERYCFDSADHHAPATLSAASADLLLINVAVPFLYAYACMRGERELEETAIDLLNEIKAENNSIIKFWRSAGLDADNAFRSQALLHLNKQYCSTKSCLTCRIGHYLLRQSMKL